MIGECVLNSNSIFELLELKEKIKLSFNLNIFSDLENPSITNMNPVEGSRGPSPKQYRTRARAREGRKIYIHILHSGAL